MNLTENQTIKTTDETFTKRICSNTFADGYVLQIGQGKAGPSISLGDYFVLSV